MKLKIRDKNLLILNAFGLAIFLAAAGLLRFKAASLSYPVIMRFNPWTGIDLIGDVRDVWLIALFAAVVFAINVGLTLRFFYRERLLSYVLSGANVLIPLLLLVVIGVIVSVN